MNIEYKSFETVNEEQLQQLYELNTQIFSEFTEPWSKEKIAQTVQNMSGCHLIFAYQDNKVVGFKGGYRHSGRRFYSWLGGVLKEFRGHGIAKEMLILQHQYAKEFGYEVVETRTKNRFKNMLIANIKFGFQITGTTMSPGDTEPVLILEKNLN